MHSNAAACGVYVCTGLRGFACVCAIVSQYVRLFSSCMCACVCVAGVCVIGLLFYLFFLCVSRWVSACHRVNCCGLVYARALIWIDVCWYVRLSGCYACESGRVNIRRCVLHVCARALRR